MKKALSLLLTITVLMMSVMCGITAISAVAANTTINVTDLGVVANDKSAASTNASKLKTSMSSCSSGTTYYFPEGTYYIASSYSVLGGSGMILSGKDDITLLGDNATIVNTSYDNTAKSTSSGYYSSGIVMATNCKNLTIEGLNFDYLDYTEVSGTIVSKTGDSVTIQLDDRYIDGTYKNALTGGEFIQCYNELDANGTPINENFTNNTSAGFTGTLSGNMYTISGTGGGNYYALSVGNRLVARFTLGTYAIPPFSLKSIKGFTVKDCNIYSCPSAVFYGTGANANFSFTNVNVAPKSDSPTFWGANVDAIHVLGLSGDITIDSCSFIGMGDDALNVHSRAGKITAVGTNSVTCVDGWDNSASLGSDWASVGDVIRFYKSDWTLLGSATVKSFSGKNMTFDELPSGVTADCYMQNTAFMPSINIKDTTVIGSRARAFLIRSENVSITGCTIKNTRLAAVIMAADISNWYEMGPSANVTISGNTFENCCVSAVGSNYGVIAIKGCDDGGGESFAAGVHKNITIENNVFKRSGASSIYASATDGLTIKGNTFEGFGNNPASGVSTATYAVAVVNCNNVTTDYNDSLYSRNSSITKIEPEDSGEVEIVEPSGEYDAELSAIEMNNYDTMVSFDNTGTDTSAVNWTAITTDPIYFNNWSGMNNRANTGMAKNFNIVNKNEFALSDGFKFQLCTTFNPNADKFNSIGHYFKFGDLKLLIDCGQNMAGSRSAGVYLYDGDTLLASADTGYAANDATFKSYYTTQNTYYYVTYTGGKLSLKTINSKGTHDVVWTLADGTANASAVPVTLDANDKTLEIYKSAGFAQYDGGNSTVVCDPKLSATFPYATVSSFAKYLASLNKTSSEAEVARARSLFDKVKANGSVGLAAEVAAYESYIIACETGGETGGGEEPTVEVDSGNMPKNFYSAATWSSDDMRMAYEMSDGSIKFDNSYSAAIGKFTNSGFTTQFNAVGGWEIELRNTSATASNGYILGYKQIRYAAEDATRVIYIRRAGSDVELARIVASSSGFTENEWHKLGVYFDDVAGKTTIRVYIDGVRVNFGPGYAHEKPDSFVNVAIENGNLVDFAPIQRGDFIKINPYFTDYVSGYGTMRFRSVDSTAADHIISIASVGDSITQGACATSREYSYPSALQRMLGTDKFNVVNFGRSGATLMTNTGDPYNIQNSYYRSLSFAADYTIIMLGTNDSTDNYWNREWSGYTDAAVPAAAKFEADLKQLINDYTNIGSKVIIMTSPASHNQYYTHVNDVVAIQKAVAAELGLDVIDMNAFTTAYGDNWQTYYDADGLHFNDTGYEAAAQYISEYFADMAQISDTAITTPDKSDVIALDQTIATPYAAKPVDGSFRGFSFWYNNDGLSILIGATGAEAWAFTNGKFDLGKNFKVDMTVENNIIPNITYTADGDFTSVKYSSVQVGALEMRIRPLNNSNGIKSFLYELYMNGVKIGSSFVDSGVNSPLARYTYTIRFINGYIAVSRDGATIMTVSPDTYAAVRNTSDYTFDGARLGYGTFELGKYSRLTYAAAETFSDIPSDYTITATEGGKILLDGAEFTGAKDYLVGETITLTATADENYIFNGWYNGAGELITKENSYTVVFEPETVVTAQFIERKVSKMTVSASTGGKVTENGADFDGTNRFVTTSATLTAVATDASYKFAYWTLNGKIVSYDATYTLTFAETGNLVAVFANQLDQQMSSTLVNIKNGYTAADWTVTGDGASIKDGAIYAGTGSNANQISAVYNQVLDLSAGFKFTTKFTWAYGTNNGYNNNVNYWGDKASFSFGDLKFIITNSYGTGTKKPVTYTLYNGDVLIGTFDTGYTATNGSYSAALEEFLNSTFRVEFDGKNVKVYSSALDADNDGTAGEYITWTLSDSTTTQSVAVGNIDLTKSVITLAKGWGGSNLKNVVYFDQLSIDGSFPFVTIAEFDAYLNTFNTVTDAATIAEARALYDLLNADVTSQLKCAPALFAAEAALNGETIDAVYKITAENGAIYVGEALLDNAGVQYGDTVTITATANTGYQFAGWYNADGELISTDAQLEVEFINTVELTATFTEKQVVSGDIDGNDVVDSADLLIISQILLNQTTVSDTTAADMNNDGSISTADLVLLQLKILGIG